jgi:hypothetical protein
MKATLEFDLSDRKQEQKFHRMMAADALCALIGNIDQYIRDKYKYGNETHIEIEQLRVDIREMKSPAVWFAMENYQ